MTKNSNVLAVSVDGWEVMESIEFMKAIKENALTESNESNDDITLNTNVQKGSRRQPIRIAGCVMMGSFFLILFFLIRAGKKREEKAWQVKATCPINGGLETEEGVNLLLDSSRVPSATIQTEPASNTHLGGEEQRTN